MIKNKSITDKFLTQFISGGGSFLFNHRFAHALQLVVDEVVVGDGAHYKPGTDAPHATWFQDSPTFFVVVGALDKLANHIAVWSLSTSYDIPARNIVNKYIIISINIYYQLIITLRTCYVLIPPNWLILQVLPLLTTTTNSSITTITTTNPTTYNILKVLLLPLPYQYY